MINIEFWFSIGSTYTYLSVQRLLEVEKNNNNIKFNWQPFSVRQIMIEMENVPFTPPPKKNKSDYMWRDIERRAKFYGFKIKVLKVNSYHNYSVNQLPKFFDLITRSSDNSIEIAKSTKYKILSFMFHPERKNISQKQINKLVFSHFKIK